MDLINVPYLHFIISHTVCALYDREAYFCKFEVIIYLDKLILKHSRVKS